MQKPVDGKCSPGTHAYRSGIEWQGGIFVFLNSSLPRLRHGVVAQVEEVVFTALLGPARVQV